MKTFACRATLLNTNSQNVNVEIIQDVGRVLISATLAITIDFGHEQRRYQDFFLQITMTTGSERVPKWSASEARRTSWLGFGEDCLIIAHLA